MDALPRFDLYRPKTIAEARAIFSATPEAQPLAGGTDLITNLRHGIGAPKALVDLNGIAGFDTIACSATDLTLGAGVKLADLAAHPDVALHYPAIAEAARAIAGPAHRRVGTVGGNLCLDTRCVFYNQAEWWRKANDYCLKHRGTICHVAPTGKRCQAAYSGDLAPALLAYRANVTIAGANGTRSLPLAALYREDGAHHLNLEPGEFITEVSLAAPGPVARSGYRKSRVRAAVDFPLAGVAAVVAMENGRFKVLSLALTGTNSRPFALDGTAELLGQACDESALKAIEKLVQKQVTPMRTTVTASNYRRVVAGVMAKRLVAELART